MRQRRAVPTQMLGMAEKLVDSRELLILLAPIIQIARRIRSEEIVSADFDQQGLRSDRIQQIPAIKTNRAGTDEILLGIVGRTGRIEICARQVFGVAGGNSRRAQAVVYAGQEHGKRSAAGLPGGSQRVGSTSSCAAR